MKKIALFVAAIAVSLSIGGRALADTNTATLADKAGITAENTILYPIDKALDDLKVSIASGDEKKDEALVEVAEERLGESEVLADKQKSDLMNEALTEYNDKIAEAQNKIDISIDSLSNTTDTTTDSSVKLDKLEKLESVIINKQMNSIEVLKNIENKVSGNAKGTLSLVIEMQTRKKEAIVEVAKERESLHQDKKAVKNAENSLEQAKKAGHEQSIKTAEEALVQAKLTLATEKEKFNQVVAAKKEAMKGGVGELKKEAKKQKTEDSTNSSEAADTTTETAPAVNAQTTTSTDAATSNTSVTNGISTNAAIKENKGQEMKINKENSAKENNGHNIKADKENNSANENKAKH